MGTNWVAFYNANSGLVLRSKVLKMENVAFEMAELQYSQ